MSPSPQLAPPGSSSYTSNTMHVGDGTWDSGRDDFLLPNLVGLNFATMRYNGMGNRFFTMAGYHNLVKAHAIIAAITFLGIIPAAIFLMRFYGRNPRNALRYHIWAQIMTLLLSTVILMLGFFAVGPKRSLTNPHHGIGVAIYVLIWVQAFGGCLIHRIKRERRFHLPLRAMLHHWLGRMIALLGIVQVALGLTLYGSPPYLFVLYALITLGLVLLYFILEWLHERRRERYGSEGSYLSEEVVGGRQENRQGGLGKLVAAGAAGVGLAALFRRRSQHRSRVDVVGTDESGTSYITDEKESIKEHHGWGRRLLEIGAIAGTVAAVRGIFNRRDRKDDSPDDGPYRPPLGGNQSITTDSMSRIEEGRPPPISGAVPPPGGSPGYIRPSHPLAAPPMTPDRRNSGSSYSYGSYISGSPSRRDRRHTWRNVLAGGGVALAARSLFKNRRQKKEERRAEELRTQRLEEERIARMNSAHRYTGDGLTAPRRLRNNRIGSQTDSDFSGSVFDGPSGTNPVYPAAGAGTAAVAALADRDRIRPVGTDPVIAPPGPSMSMPTDIPPIPPPHRGDLDSSGSEMYTTGSGRPRHRHRLRDEAAAGLAGAAIGAVATDARRRHSGRNTDSLESPPVSLKVKMHNDGRHVTLRRLTEDEAAAQRDARRHERRGSSGRRRRNSSMSSSSAGERLGGGAGGDGRWRRAEAIEAQQEAENRAAAASATIPVAAYPPPPPPLPGTHAPPFAPAVDPQTGQTYNVPPPPPIPGSSSGLGGAAGSITSPGTETSGGATEYANNRRRRRAERAQAKLAREGRAGGGNTVDFT